MISGRSKLKPPRWLPWTLFIASLLLPLLTRILSGAPLTPLDTSYQQLLASGVPVYSPYLWILSVFETFSISWMLPFFLGLVNFALMARLLPKIMTEKNKERKTLLYRYALILFALSPFIITIHVAQSPLALCLLFTIVGTMAYLKRGPFGDIIAALAFAGFVATSPAAGIITAAVFLFRGGLRKRWRFVGLLTLLTIIVGWLANINGFVLPQQDAHILLTGFGEFGGLFGYSLFIIILAFLGILCCWKDIDKMRAVAFILLLAASFAIIGLRPLAIILVVLYASNGLVALLERRWSVEMLRQATLILLFCLALFVFITHVRLLTDASPTAQFIDLLNELKEQNQPGTVLTLQHNQGTVEYFTDRTVVTPPEELFSLVSMAEVTPWFIEHDVRYVLITPEMKQGYPWRRDDEGMLFLLHHNEKFVSVAAMDDYELWLFLREYAPVNR